MSLCETCREPGHCCKAFNLTGTGDHHVTFWDDDVPHFDRFPFVPLYRIGQGTVEFGPEAGRTYSWWRWGCPKLGADGRCTIYDTRPQLCRDFEPGSNPLCIEYDEKSSLRFKGIPIVREETCAT
jgi:Fe-S-cluster containining protein